MYKFLPRDQKISLIKRVEAGESISKVCKEKGISRTIFYIWYKQYKNPVEKSALCPKKAKGKKHWRKLSRKIESKVIKTALKNPSFSPKNTAKSLELSTGFVWNTLKKNDLNTKDKRLLYIERNGTSLVKSKPVSDKITMIRRFEQGEKISNICRDFNVSRTIFYRWLKRYQGAVNDRKREVLESSRPKGEKHWRFIPGVPELIIKIVIEHPELSFRKINNFLLQKEGKRIVCNTQVYNILKRLNLNTYQRRLAFAKSQTVVVPAREEEKAWSFPLFGRFEIISVIPPPIRKHIFSKTFLSLSSLSFALFSILIFLLKTIAQAGNMTSGIGTIFALFSLMVGMLFFLYSFKSYLTIGIVLSFSRQKEEKAKGEERRSIWERIFGISISIGRENKGVSAKADIPVLSSGAWQTRGKGLQPDLSHITLDRKPFVSIHLATYNEKRVINRLLTAATSMDYENYEIIVADDSTDETIDILRQWEKHPKVKILHRATRQGYKGAALSDALRKTDPRAEFVVVFDADFIPYPDTITQFLKYFKAVNGDLNPQTIQNTKNVAVQGYQWHVLNKSENWITRGVRTEYSGSYVLERSGAEIYGGLKQIAGSVYMITKNALSEIGWGTSITEDLQLTLKLYEAGYKVIYTPYVQAPSECVSTIKRLIRQRMRWAEGHSFNVKKMFIRLLVGKWVNKGDLAFEESSKFKVQSSKLNSEFNNERTWVKSPLTFAEKLEFVYVSPYYFQAFLFMLGTFSWLMAEVVFKVQLPFWTEVWGWSLVFTNLFALPLMNLVGLFLEEAEEKDYIGLLSFIALSYIVAPFQGYAALKGFLEKEEGPWFRTPKTGRITDALAQGRLYRFVRGILGRPVVSPVHANNMRMEIMRMNANEQTSGSRYLALATANNTFNNFKIKPKKLRWIGKTSLVSIIIFSFLLNIFSFDFNSNPSPNSFSKSIIKGKQGFKIESKNTFALNEVPEFYLKVPQGNNNIKKSWNPFGPKKAEAATPKVETSIVDINGVEVKDVNTKVIQQDSDFKLSLPQTSKLKPGKYTLKTSWTDNSGQVYESSQDFRWGVLAINPNKSIYAKGEEVKLGFGVLDDQGKTICDADLSLEISDPEKTKVYLYEKAGQIKRSEKCSATSVTNTPDYFTQFKVDKIGAYKLHLVATTENGTREIDDQFEVKDAKDIPFEIERSSYPTRIYPPAEYPVTLTVKANQDFQGTIEDTVPDSFEISKIALSQAPPPVMLNSVQHLNGILKQVQDDKGTQTISWNVNWKKGETHQLNYTIKFPRKSPEFYLVGPLTFRHPELARLAAKRVSGSNNGILKQVQNDKEIIFQEARQWQIASDVVTTIFQEPGTDATGDLKLFGYTEGTVTSDTGTKKTGPRSVKVDTGGSNWAALFETTSAASDAGARLSFYFQMPNWPATADGDIIYINSGGGGITMIVTVTTAGKLKVTNDLGSGGATGTTVLSTNTWYRISLAYTITDGSTNEFRVFLDGATPAEVSVSNMTLNRWNTTTAAIGVMSSGWGANKTAFFDDIYQDNSNALTDTGDIRVTAKLPSADTTRGWDSIIGAGGACVNDSTEYGCVNERPLSQSKGVQDVTQAGTPVENFAIQDADTGDVAMSQNTIVARTAWVWAERSGATGTLAVNMYNNGSTAGITLTTTPKMFTNIVDSSTYPSNTAAVGMSAANSAVDTMMYETGMLVSFIGAPVPEAALLAAPLAAFAPKIIKSIKNGTFKKNLVNLFRRLFLHIELAVSKLIGFAKLKRVLKRKLGIRDWRKKRRKFHDDS